MNMTLNKIKTEISTYTDKMNWTKKHTRNIRKSFIYIKICVI